MDSEVRLSEGSGETVHEEAAPEKDTARRGVLKALGAAAAGAVAGGLLSPRQALAHGGFHQDSNNSDPAIHGNNTVGGPGVQGTSATGAGVHGEGSTGVLGSGRTSGIGVRGHSQNSAGVYGEGSTGVFGLGHPGVLGQGVGETGTGVWGGTRSGIAVRALSGDAGTAVSAENEGTGTALSVSGRTRFSTAGSGTIPAGQDSVFVGNAAVTNQSHITVTLTGNPGVPLSGFPIVIHWVERMPGSGFMLRMTRRVGPATPFTYLIIEPL
jgi:hypothetical protein